MTMYFTKEHEWIRVEGDSATVGISNHAQEALGDIVFAEVPEAGKQLAKGQEAAVVESVKAASESIRRFRAKSRRAIRRSPTIRRSSTATPKAKAGSSGSKLTGPNEFDGLMDEAAYREWVKTL